MKLDDGKPWFRRWVGIARKPITREGRIVVASTASICTVSALLWVAFAKDYPGWAAVAAAIFFAAALAGNFIMFWKTEDTF